MHASDQQGPACLPRAANHCYSSCPCLPATLITPTSAGGVGPTSKDVAAGLGSGAKERSGMTDTGRAQREAADPSLQRGQQQKPAA
jgi:hypothetical protein